MPSIKITPKLIKRSVPIYAKHPDSEEFWLLGFKRKPTSKHAKQEPTWLRDYIRNGTVPPPNQVIDLQKVPEPVLAEWLSKTRQKAPSASENTVKETSET